MKDPKKVKAGRARWMNVSAEDRRKQASKNGKKGAEALHKKYKLVERKLQHEKVIQQDVLAKSSTI